MLWTVSAIGNGTLESKDWDVYTLGVREYVSDENVAKFYDFERFAKKDDDRLFMHPSLIMTWKIGSESIYMNNIKFNLSFPVIENGGMAMLSTVDLAKLVDPVVRPSYIREPIRFETVIIDPGHGGEDSGIRGLYGWEKNYTLDLALRFADKLSGLGFKSRLTRDTDVVLSLQDRVRIANEADEAIFISLHFGPEEDPLQRGIRTFALAPQGTTSSEGGNSWESPLQGNARDAENIALATAVHSHVVSSYAEAVDLGVSRARFNILRGIKMPAILFEGGSLTDPGEAAKIASEAYRGQLAEELAMAVTRFKKAVLKSGEGNSGESYGAGLSAPTFPADPRWPGSWSIAYFNWTAETDPVANLEAWRALANGDSASKTTSGELNFEYEPKGPIDLNEPLRRSGLSPERFGMIAANQMPLGKSEYLFEVFGGDDVRVWVAGKLLIDGWSKPRGETLSALWRQNEEGTVEVKVEHFGNEGWASLRLSVWDDSLGTRLDLAPVAPYDQARTPSDPGPSAGREPRG